MDKQLGNDSFIGGMTDWFERDLNVTFDFLDDVNYKATICKDAINADRYAADYVLQKDVPVKKNKSMKIHLPPGGGFLIRLNKQ